MVMRSLWAFVGILLIGSMTVSSSADDRGTGASVRLAAAGVGFDREGAQHRAVLRYSPRPSLSPPTTRDGLHDGFLQKVQGYYCRACRRRCVADFRIDCEETEGWCRRQFTRCMRQCWEDECR